MLVLSRQRDETIMIGDEIEITIVDVRGEKVRLGINAPTHIAVHRKEVYAAITRENAAAAQISGDDLTSLTPPAASKTPPAGRTQELVSAKADASRPKDSGTPPEPARAPTVVESPPAALVSTTTESGSSSARPLRRTA